MQGKFEINWNYYPTNQSKLIYTKNRVRGKTLQYLKPCHYINSLISFTTIKDLFNSFKDIFNNFH